MYLHYVLCLRLPNLKHQHYINDLAISNVSESKYLGIIETQNHHDCEIKNLCQHAGGKYLCLKLYCAPMTTWCNLNILIKIHVVPDK